MRRHVTFIHGIKNQLRSDLLLESWKATLAEGDGGLDLENHDVTTSMVYWADVMYAEPKQPAGNESVGFESSDADEAGLVDEGYQSTSDPDEAAFLSAMTNRLQWDADDSPASGDVGAVGEAVAEGLEAVPLPWFIKRPLMKIFLRDVHHYLFNTSHTPGTTSYKVQDEIRSRFLADLMAVDADRHVVVAHSMGTVITYDLLKRVPDTTDVDALVTLGSPLGLSEIQDKFAPEWSAEDGFPDKLRTWFNFADGLDPVCGADPKIANDYRKADTPVIADIFVTNSGIFRHPVDEYLRQQQVRNAIRESLALT